MKIRPDRNLLHEIQRRDLHAFFHSTFLELNPDTPFLDNWHIAVIAAVLERVRSGEIRRLIINMPPRSLKSHCVTVALPAWLLGHNPAEQIITVSYAQEPADKHARDCRRLMSSAFYRKIFPGTRLSRVRHAVNEFETTKNGLRLSTSIGGPLTGRGANVIIMDDPQKPEEALSDAQRERAIDWFGNTLLSRLNNKATGAIVNVTQRLHERDLTGYLASQGGWEILSFPAIAEHEEEYHWQTPYGPQRHLRREGDVLHAAREPRHVLEEIKRALGSYSFAGQYQQSPAPLGGGLIKPEWFRRYAQHELPDQFDYKLQSWDTANKPGELANYTVCTTWGIKKQDIYLLNVLRRRLGYLDLKAQAKSQAAIFSPKIILIEDKASGTQLIQDLSIENLSGVVGYQPDGDKILRMSVQAALVENGEVYIPQAAPWLDDYLHEISTFPRARYSDQVDSTSQALDWIKRNRNPGAQGYVEYYRRLAEEAGAQPTRGPTRAMEAPPTVQKSRMNDGRWLTKGPDGLFQVPLDAVPLMLAAGWRLR